MRSRPKIPRTPISKELLDMAKKGGNDSFISTSSHAVNEVKTAEAKEEKKAESVVPPAPNQEPPVIINEVRKIVEEEIKGAKSEAKVGKPNEEIKGAEVPKEQKKTDPMTKTQEFEFAFKSRSKIPHSPAQKDRKPGPPDPSAKKTKELPPKKKR